MASRPHPYVTIPPGAASAVNSSPSVHETALSPINLWQDRRRSYIPYTPTASSSYPGQRISLDVPGRPPSRASSAYEEPTRIAFPEPQLYRSSSQRSTYRSNGSAYTHRSTRSESVLSPDSLLTPTQHSVHTGESRPPSFENTPEVCPFLNMQRTVSIPSCESGVQSRIPQRLYQSNEGKEASQEWFPFIMGKKSVLGMFGRVIIRSCVKEAKIRYRSLVSELCRQSFPTSRESLVLRGYDPPI